MDPDSPFIRIYSSIPVAQAVSVHSIIAVNNPEDPKEDWNDGVVAILPWAEVRGNLVTMHTAT